MCQYAAQGRCKYGESCRFAHCVEELAEAVEYDGLDEITNDPSGSSSSEEPSTISPQHQSQRRHDIMDIRTPSSEPADDLDEISHFQVDGSESEYDSDDSGTESTKASTMASVSTPRGGSEASSTHAFVLKKNDPTTMILKNVPECLTQGALVSLFEDLSFHMRGTFDFFYLPWNPHQCRNLGYAIINFFDSGIAAAFKHEFNSMDLTRGCGYEKGLEIIPAILQGRIANIKHFSAFSLALHANLRFRPLLRQTPQEPLRAMYVAPEFIVHY